METEVTELLEAGGIDFEVKVHDAPALTCEDAARERNVRVSQIVKCMVAKTGDGSLVVMLIPGDKTLKSSKARKYLGADSLGLVDPTELADELGLTVGAISPLQLLGRARILMDPNVLEERIVDISSGDPLAGVELSSSDLKEVLEAELVSMISRN